MARSRLMVLIAVGLLVSAAGVAEAGYVNPYTFSGNGNWSIDAVGSNSTPVGSISAIVPTGSTVVKAFLYSTTYGNDGIFTPSVGFDGTTISGGDWTHLGTATSSDVTAFRADVTALVVAKIGGGSVVPFSFSIDSESPNGSVDGEALVIIYSNPGEVVRTIAILDGFSDPLGDDGAFNFASPLGDPNAVGFEAIMSLGIGFGFQGVGQHSLVDVNGSRLTSSAGGQDDGFGANGALITVGGIGDSLTNPAPFSTSNGDPRQDDELYDLRSFLAAGDNSFSFTTLNPSNDDNIFFVGLNITAEGRVVVGTVPLPAAAWMGLTLLGGLGAFRLFGRRRR